MRTPSESSSALQSPLDQILGTEGNVRILRLLATTAGPLSKAAIARRTGLNESGAGRSVSRLAELGVVESLGAGSRRLYRMRDAHPLASPLSDLFAGELQRFESLIDRLRAAARALKPPPHAAWIQGAVVTGCDEPGDPIVVGILGTARSVGPLVDGFRTAAVRVQMDGDVTVFVRGFTLADLAALPDKRLAELQVTIPLIGPPPLGLLPRTQAGRGGGAAGAHEDLDRRTLAFAGAIAARLSEDPSLVDRARTYVRRRLATASEQERKALEEWLRILDTTSLARLKRLLIDPSEQATELRQTIPFVDALSAAERRAIVSKCRYDQG